MQYDDSVNQIVKTFKVISKEEKPIWFKEFISLDKVNNNSFFSLLVDITDIKQKEIEFNNIIEAKTVQNNSKDKLISIISHDLRAPFTSLLGFSEILLNEPNLGEEEKREYLNYIYDASQIQLQMVNHLLDWTRLQTGAMKFEPQRIEIRDIIENCISVLTGVAIRKNIEIKVEGGKGVFVNADEKLITQAITNLLSNAVKFTPGGKKIKVDIGLFKENMIEVIVKDEGVGISESNQMKLFKVESKFSQIGTAGEKGSGLGLALVKEIVDKHSGKIWFYSELQKGSEFHFTIPRADDTILIVEEHEDLRKEYEKIFKIKFPNFNITYCKTGFEAMNFILERIPSVIISYHKMPLMNGLQLASSLRKKDIHNKVQVIILADKLNDDDIVEYKKIKVDNFINFNKSPKEIAELVSGIIS
ncbi:MAG: hybrid sensor histidine kinase/response regulator [Ignavibacteriales bacterium]|nr:hybrid sensor histidine kinase/response regulator [Ignavibacteriales bacterium]